MEDDFALREFTQIILSHYHYRVLTAKTGHEAVEIWEKHQEEIALLFTDIVMPGGLSGIDIGQRFYKEKPELKIVYTSGYLFETITGSTIIQKTGVFLPKPYFPSQVNRLFRELLDA